MKKLSTEIELNKRTRYVAKARRLDTARNVKNRKGKAEFQDEKNIRLAKILLDKRRKKAQNLCIETEGKQP